MSSTDDLCTVTSVSLTIRQLSWLKAHEGNRSELFRRLLDAYIESVEGFGAPIDRLEQERAALERRLRETTVELERLYEQQREFLDVKEEDRDARIKRLREELSIR